MVSFARLLAASTEGAEHAAAAPRDPPAWLRGLAVVPRVLPDAVSEFPAELLPPQDNTARNTALDSFPQPSEETADSRRLSDSVSALQGRGDVPETRSASQPWSGTEAGLLCVPSLDRLLTDLGPESTLEENMLSLKAILSRFGRPREDAIAKALLMMATAQPANSGETPPTSEPPTVFQMFRLFATPAELAAQTQQSTQQMSASTIDAHEWNPDTFIRIVNDLAVANGQGIDWAALIRSLDTEDLPAVLTPRSFQALSRAHTVATGRSGLPGEAFVGSWTYPRSQLAILTFALTSPGTVNWETVKPAVESPSEDPASPFRCVPVVEALVNLDARQLLQAALVASPELMVMALAVASPRHNGALRQQFLVTLLASRISTLPPKDPVLRHLWEGSPPIVDAALLQVWRNDPSQLPRLFEIVLELKALAHVLGSEARLPFGFTLELGMHAFRREHLNLDKWITERLATDGAVFLTACVAYLSETVATPQHVAAKQLSLEASAILFKCLFASIPQHNSQPGMAETAAELRRVYDIFVRLNPRLSNLTAGWDGSNKDMGVGSVEARKAAEIPVRVGDASGLPPSAASSGNPTAGLDAPDFATPGEDPVVYPAEVDDEANANFRRLYQEQISVEQTVELLRQLQSSSSVHSRSVFSCMIHTLFDEYRFLRNYPERELRITGMLFGALAQFSILQGAELGVLLNHILLALESISEDLKGPTRTVGRLAKFGVCALERCLTRLSSFPLFSARVLAIDELRATVPQLINDVELAYKKASSAVGLGQPSPIELEMNAPWIPNGLVPPDDTLALNRTGANGALGGTGISDPVVSDAQGQLPVSALSAGSTVKGGPAAGVRGAETGAGDGADASPAKRSVMDPTVALAADPGRTVATAHSEKDESSRSAINVTGLPAGSTAASQTAGPDAVSALISSPPLSGSRTPQRGLNGVLSSGLRPSPSTGEGGFQFASVNMDTLLATKHNSMVVPDEDTQNKIHFIFNNLSNSNMDEKEREMACFLEPVHVDFLAYYIVVKRASIEPNFHELYISFLGRLANLFPKVFPRVLDRSFDNVRILLESERIVSSSSERLLLKSLGSWIGSLTLAQNRPILRRDLDMKELLLDAYSNGRLIAVVPFVSKVLNAVCSSRIFRPPNPWLTAILRLLKEIYDVPDLKLNVKFELPLLTKALGIEANDIVKSDLLKLRPAPVRDGNPDFTAIKKVGTGMASPGRSSSPTTSPPQGLPEGFAPVSMQPEPTAGQGNVPIFSLGTGPTTSGVPTSGAGVGRELASVAGAMNVRATGPNPNAIGDIPAIMSNPALPTVGLASGSVPQGTTFPHLTGLQGVAGASASGGVAAAAAVAAAQHAAAAAANVSDSTSLSNFAQHVTIGTNLILFQSSPQLKRYIPIAIERAVHEIIQPVVERSCAIASITTRELTLKDFANEPNGTKIQKAARQMVQQLAGSLALVTCKEPLRVSMGNQFRPLLSAAAAGDSNLLEHTIQALCTSNLEVGCAMIERAASEKAARDIDEVVATVFMTRRQQEQQQQRLSYGLPSSPSSALDVIRVYEDFTRLQRAAAATTSSGTNTGQAYYPAPAAGTQASAASRDGAFQAAGPAPQAAGVSSLQQAPVQQPTPVRPAARPSTAPGRQQPYPGPRPMSAPGAAIQESMGRPVGPSPPPAQRDAVAPSSEVVGAAFVAPPPTPAVPIASPSAMAEAMRQAAAQAPAVASTQTTSSTALPNVPGEEKLSTQQVLERFNTVYSQLTRAIERAIDAADSPSAGKDGRAELTLSELPADHEVQVCRTQIAQAVKRSVTADEASMAIAQKLFKRLYEGNSNLHREVHVALLESMRECSRRLSKELVSWLAYSEDAKKLHRECIIALLRPGSLLHITSYDELVAKTCENGRNTSALDFAAFLVRRAIIEEPLATTRELYMTLEVLAKAGRRSADLALPSAPEGLLALVEASRRVVHRPAPSPTGGTQGAGALAGGSSTQGPGNSADSHVLAAARAAKAMAEAESQDPAGSRETVASVLTEWQRILASGSQTQRIPDHIVASFVTQAKSTTLYNDETRDRFLRLGIELVCTATSAALNAKAGVPGAVSPILSTPFSPVESMARLVAALCKAETSGESTSKGVAVLTSYFHALVRCIVKATHEGDVRPHYRLFLDVVTELSAGVPPPDTLDPNASSASDTDGPSLTASPPPNGDAGAIWNGLDPAFSGRGGDHGVPGAVSPGPESTVSTANPQVLAALANSLNACNPTVAPSFAFAWLQLISNRNVMPRLLGQKGAKGWPLFRQMLVSQFNFLFPHLSRTTAEGELHSGVRMLYRGTLRVLLILLHDFPEFLCDYHFALCDAIPYNCIQLRNLVLSAYPRTMRLPDPSMPNLKVDQLPEMSQEPRVLSNLTTALVSAGLKGPVDQYLQNAGTRPVPASSLGLHEKLLSKDSDSPKGPYNLAAMNALILYIGRYFVNQSTQGTQPAINGPCTELIRGLVMDLDAEGRYHLLNAIANQLRYPNNHTHYFSCVMLYLFRFSGGEEEEIREQITRVLVERLIAFRPHPWGLLITFIELIKNPTYNFWSHGFVRCAPQIERLFDNVNRFCSGGGGAGVTAGGGKAGGDAGALAGGSSAASAPATGLPQVSAV